MQRHTGKRERLPSPEALDATLAAWKACALETREREPHRRRARPDARPEPRRAAGARLGAAQRAGAPAIALRDPISGLRLLPLALAADAIRAGSRTCFVTVRLGDALIPERQGSRSTVGGLMLNRGRWCWRCSPAAGRSAAQESGNAVYGGARRNTSGVMLGNLVTMDSKDPARPLRRGQRAREPRRRTSTSQCSRLPSRAAASRKERAPRRADRRAAARAAGARVKEADVFVDYVLQNHVYDLAVRQDREGTALRVPDQEERCGEIQGPGTPRVDPAAASRRRSST